MAQVKVRLNGRWMEMPTTTTDEEIRRAAGIDPLRNLVQKTREGHYLVPRGSSVNLSDGDDFLDSPARVKGYIPESREFALYDDQVDTFAEAPSEVLLDSPRKERIFRETMMVSPHFSKYRGVFVDLHDFEWLVIPKYPLPQRWERRWCKLLILFPDQYPVTPPIGFYLNRRFRLWDENRDQHLHGEGLFDAPDLQELGWIWYCVTIMGAHQGGWRPSADYRKPDNLWTFLRMVRDVLTNDED